MKQDHKGCGAYCKIWRDGLDGAHDITRLPHVNPPNIPHTHAASSPVRHIILSSRLSFLPGERYSQLDGQCNAEHSHVIVCTTSYYRKTVYTAKKKNEGGKEK
uniref:Uncharacterized protein n=1 Tax=Trypanosoma congolense (strain IL3000) TaxID=1068625 RepID=G0URR8_TRYCI|nr:hypothetical protein, unlikely [Trypanosoma congolense IL3000]